MAENTKNCPELSDLERPFNKNKKFGQVVRVSKSIWKDPSFRALSVSAQWLYFWRITQVDRRVFDVDAMKRDSGFSDLEADQVIDEIRGSKYAAIVVDRVQREWIPHEERMVVFGRDSFKCLHCGTRRKLTIDHIIPVALGGPNELSNYQTLCRRCNSRKGVKVGGN